ncbi:hypothetical protein, partial [Aminivibrio sp.]|uniref:hypothetical protein n=1 Tax=Aminivibrio sp. TaxID=1872489 RepID=UPI002D1FB23B
MKAITTSVEYHTCFFPGHVTFFNSARASRTKVRIFSTTSASYLFNDNKKMAGPAGLEPATPGF